MGKNKKKQQTLIMMDGMDMEPKEDMMMMEEEEKPLMPATPNFGGEDSDDEDESLPRIEQLTACCCCMCVCYNDLTEKLTCCCCCPIKFGVQFIGGLTMVLTFYYISWNFFLILNDQVAWWFPVVTITLLIPLYLASAFFVTGSSRIPLAAVPSSPLLSSFHWFPSSWSPFGMLSTRGMRSSSVMESPKTSIRSSKRSNTSSRFSLSQQSFSLFSLTSSVSSRPTRMLLERESQKKRRKT